MAAKKKPPAKPAPKSAAKPTPASSKPAAKSGVKGKLESAPPKAVVEKPAPRPAATKAPAPKAPPEAKGKPAKGTPAPKPAPPPKATSRPVPVDLDELDEPDEAALARESEGADDEPPGAAPPAPPPVSAPRRGAKGGVIAKPALSDEDDASDDDASDDDVSEGDAAEGGAAEGVGAGATAAPVPAPTSAAGTAVAPAAPRPVAPRPIPPMPPRKPGVITFAISPDADDAFMVYAMDQRKIELEGRRYEIIREDIATLNEKAKRGVYDATAFSFGAWPQMADRYYALSSGGSFGDHVGPIVVAKTPVRSNEVHGLHVVVPGLTTTAVLVLRMWLHPNRLKLEDVPFESVAPRVVEGKARAGVLIHESQMTPKALGLTKVVDLGLWWGERTDGLPLPLGGNAVRRDIPPEERAQIALDFKRSIAYALGHREEGLNYAQPFSHGVAREVLDKYVARYVNEMSLDYAERGKQAISALFAEAKRLGLYRHDVELELNP